MDRINNNEPGLGIVGEDGTIFIPTLVGDDCRRLLREALLCSGSTLVDGYRHAFTDDGGEARSVIDRPLSVVLSGGDDFDLERYVFYLPDVSTREKFVDMFCQVYVGGLNDSKISRAKLACATLYGLKVERSKLAHLMHYLENVPVGKDDGNYGFTETEASIYCPEYFSYPDEKINFFTEVTRDPDDALKLLLDRWYDKYMVTRGSHVEEQE